MDRDGALILIAIIGAVLTWTASIVSLVMWLTGKFRSLEAAIYRETNRLGTRVQRLELKVFGFTHSGESSLTDPPKLREPLSQRYTGEGQS